MSFPRPTSIGFIACALVSAGCALIESAPENSDALPPIRFLLTFDDGPSPALSDNPTEQVVTTLANNSIQPGVKAIFFIQTRWSGAGGSIVGQSLLRRMVAEGHVLGIHSGTVHGHLNHRRMKPPELLESMTQGSADIELVSGKSAELVRPTFWAFDESTLATYERARVSMLLTDLRARDGWYAWYQVDPEFGGRLHRDLHYFQQRLIGKQIQIVDGAAPVVVTFHDTSRFTAERMETYLRTLVEVGRSAGMKIAEPAFYTDHDQLRKAALARASNRATRADIAP